MNKFLLIVIGYFILGLISAVICFILDIKSWKRDKLMYSLGDLFMHLFIIFVWPIFLWILIIDKKDNIILFDFRDKDKR